MKYISGRCPYFFKKNHAAWHHVFSILPVFLEYVLEIFWKLPLDTSVLEFQMRSLISLISVLKFLIVAPQMMQMTQDLCQAA